MELRIIHVDREIAAELGVDHAFDLRIGTWSEEELEDDGIVYEPYEDVIEASAN